MLTADGTQVIDLAAIALSIITFSVGAVADLRTREVQDRLWLFYGSAGSALTLVRFVLTPSELMLGLLSVTLTCTISVLLFFLGFMGGADSKAFICLAATLPLNPTILKPMIGYVLPFFPLTVLISSFVLSATTSLWTVMRNFRAYLKEGKTMFQEFGQEAWYSKLMAVLIGFRVDQEELRKNTFLYPIEVADSSRFSGRRFKLSFNVDSDREKEVRQLLSSLSNSSTRVWVTPGLPMLLFVLVGLLFTVSVGDLVVGGLFGIMARAR
jgi:Flp pilus assembly protein protease CpaA